MARKSRNAAPGPAAPRATGERIEEADIAGILRANYQEYATAVVVGRALPDVRDGLKPVHRRILYAMKAGGYDWNTGYRKSARITGDVIGKFHPHGDSSVYDALTRLTQPWSLTAPLIDGQGNFGSPDGDAPAAMRYTEARLAPVARHLLDEIGRDTVDFQPNYDETETEPVVLPAAFPHILVNGGSGIAVGMASTVPPHNLGEVIDAALLRLNAPAADLDALMARIPGPDFPTGGRILGQNGIRKAYETGRGTLEIEATLDVESEGRTPLLVYTDIPWGTTRPGVLARINHLIGETGLGDVVSARDETGRGGARFVVELRPGADPERNDALLKAQTGLRASVSLNLTLLDTHGVPREMGLAEILDQWIAFRRTTVRRRATYDLARARDRGRLLLGRMAALSVIDRIVKTIRGSATREEAAEAICALSFAAADFSDLVDLLGTRAQKKGKRFRLTRGQADDILAMRLGRLTAMEREGLEEEARQLVARMHALRAMLSDRTKLDAAIGEELAAVRAAPGAVQERRTRIDADARPAEVRATAASVAPAEPTTVIETREGTYLRARKGVPDALRGQVRRAVAADTHARLVFITDRGQAYGAGVAELPAAEAKEAPRPVPGILGLTPSGTIAAAPVLWAGDLESPEAGGAILTFVTRDAMIRRTPAAEFARIPQPGKMAMKIESASPETERILTVFRETRGADGAAPAGGAVFLATAAGRVLRFALADLRIFNGRAARGLRGMKLDAGDRLVAAFEVPDIALSAALADEVESGWLGRTPRKKLSAQAAALLDGPEIVQLAASGHAKRTPLHAYRQARRDGRGIADKGPAKTIGEIVDVRPVTAAETADAQAEILLAGADGPLPVALAKLRKGGRATTGGIIG